LFAFTHVLLLSNTNSAILWSPTARPRSHCMRPGKGTCHRRMTGLASVTSPLRSRRPLKASSRLRRIEAEVTVGQWVTTLLVVVMVLEHYTRFVPSPERAPVHRADFARDPDQLQCPCSLGLVDRIPRNRRFSNGYRHAADLGHGMKGSQELKRSERTLSFPRSGSSMVSLLASRPSA
jgi:hypothetical protein